MVQVNADLWPVTLEEARFHRYARWEKSHSSSTVTSRAAWIADGGITGCH